MELRARTARLPAIALVACALAGTAPAVAAAAPSGRAVVALAPRDAPALAAYAQAVTTPGSSRYHRFLSVAQFARRFGPTGAQRHAVRARLIARGLTPGRTSANGLTLAVSGADARAAAAALPRGLVQGVIDAGTQAPSASVAIRRSRIPAGGPTPDDATATSGPCPAATGLAATAGAHTADQIASAYGLSSLRAAGDEGAGVTVALYELEPFSPADVAAYQACYETSASVTEIPVDGGPGAGAGTGEAVSDIEDVVGLAPQARIDVYSGPHTAAGAFDTYSRIVSDDAAQIISTSWGTCEALKGAAPVAAENTLFEEAAVQGQAIVAASGDEGSDDCGIGIRSVDDPASQPWVTGVGGTTDPGADTVWNDASGAGGGGVSTLWARPSYQAADAQSESVVRCAGAGTDCREVPDLSADADPASGYVVAYDGTWATAGGTSVAAPTVAAFAALTEASPSCGGRRIGFLNPALYRASAADFGDVAEGSNSSGGVSGFAAGPGYDMASGLGTPTSALAAFLCAAPA